MAKFGTSNPDRTISLKGYSACLKIIINPGLRDKKLAIDHLRYDTAHYCISAQSNDPVSPAVNHVLHVIFMVYRVLQT